MAGQVDTSIGDLAGAPAEVARGQRRVLVRGLVNIKKQMQADVSGYKTLPRFAKSINFDIEATARGWSHC